MFPEKVISKHIRAARKRIELTQRSVAESASVPISYYGKMERGEICPSIVRLVRVCCVLRIPMADVFEGVEESAMSLDNIRPTNEEFVKFVTAISAQTGELGKHAIMVMCQEITKMKE